MDSKLPNAQTFHQPPTETLDIGYAELAYRRFGSGPDLVFVHGWPVNMSTWRDIVAVLAEDYTCHLFDLPGVGYTRSDGAPRVHLEQAAESVQHAVDAIGLTQYGLVGHDSGGTIARLVAAARPEQVTALILGNTEIPGDHPTLIQMLKVLAAIPGGAHALKMMMKTGWIRRSNLVGFGSCFVDPRFVDGEFYKLTLRPLIEDADTLNSAMAFLKAFDFGLIDSLTETHAAIRCPTLLIWGERDAVFTLKKARAMMTQFSSEVEMATIPAGRLFAHEEFPTQFASHTTTILHQLNTNSTAEIVKAASGGRG